MTTLQDLGLAYRKAKVDLYYSSHASLDAIADYEENLHANLSALLVKLQGDDESWVTQPEYIGGMPMQCINDKTRKGVFYPLETFSKNKEVDFKTVPICLETESESDYKILEKLAFSLSEKVYSISSEQRKSLHIAAVFVCNFVNHLYKIGNDICVENNIPFEILLPLIEETASKIEYLTPSEAQTGPAIRNDNNTIN